MSNLEMIEANITAMNKKDGFDAIIICCSSSKQAEYWQNRLDATKGELIPSFSLILAVEEDWPGGAGNALGTLYAFQKANALSKKKYSRDIFQELANKTISVGLYHTAGKGTRLAPLPGAENNNKPGVKLPISTKVLDSEVPMTILEAVIKQTGCYSLSRRGRLSVFWGDQVFIPTVGVKYQVTHHVDILCSLGPMPSEEEWKAKGMDKYGLIAQNHNGNGAQVEKVDHSTAVKLLSGLGEIKSVGASLGSFSVSFEILKTLLDEFSSELERKEGKYDTDPHLWMPMTLEKPSYLQIMMQKGISEDISSKHFDRISKMMEKFYREYPDSHLGLFGPVDVGQGVFWWDYGQLKLYQKNTMLLTEESNEARLLRKFYNIESKVSASMLKNTEIDNQSCVSNSILGTENDNQNGYVKRSVLSNVKCKHIEAENCILINVVAEKIVAKPGSIIYNVIQSDANSSNGLIELGDNDVLVGVFDNDGNQINIKSNINIDGGKAWSEVVNGNSFSFEEIYKKNSDSCPSKIEQVIQKLSETTWSNL